MLWTIVIVLLLVSLAGGGLGYSRYGYGGFSPLAVILIVGVILYYTGHLRLG